MTNQPLDAVTIPTPTGPLAVILDDGVVVASGFTSVDDQFGRLAEPLRARGVRQHDVLEPVSSAVAAYVAGDVDALDAIEVRQPGGEYTQEVWRVMRQIPAGQTWSYSELAAKAGRPAAVRAAGSACAKNLVAPFVPCHRVVRSDGSLGGYYYGLPTKQWLLAHEAGAEQLSPS